MKVEESFSPVTDLANLDRTPCLEGEPSIKNIHTSTHLLILDNSLLFLAIDQALHVYSLAKIAQNKAPLLNIISLSYLFKYTLREHYQDLISSIFSNAQKEHFSKQIFQGEGNSNNVLLNVEHYSNRLKYLNNSVMRIKHMEFNKKGELAILLVDGRGVVVSYPGDKTSSSWWASQKYQIFYLNELTKQKIDLLCFADDQTICMLTNGRIAAFEFKQKSKVFSHKIVIAHANQLSTRKMEKERYRLYLVCSTTMQILEPNRKKIAIHQNVSFDSYISRCFFHHSQIFVVTVDSIIRLSSSSPHPHKELLCKLSEPCEVLHIDSFGNYTKKYCSSSRESLWLVDCTSNGVYAGVTMRRGGNYKQGRLVVFEPTQEYYIHRLISNVKELQERKQGYIDISDALFIPKKKENKQILQTFSNLHKQDALIFNKVPMTEQQYYIVSINIGHAFQGKDLAKAKIIEKILNARFMGMISLKKKLDYVGLVERCCFTGVPIYDEEVNYCRLCDIFGIIGKGDRCVVCWKKMLPYE